MIDHEHEELPDPLSKTELKNDPTNLRLGLSVFLLCVILGIGLLHRIVNYSPTYRKNTAPNNASPSAATPTTKIDCSKYQYQNQTALDLTKTMSVPAALKKQILLKMENAEYIKKLIGKNEHVSRIKYHEPTQQITYIFGLDGYDDPEGFRTVHLFDIKTGQDKEVFRFQNENLNAQGGILESDFLRDTAFSQDGKELIFSSNTHIWQYTIATNQLTELYTKTDSKGESAYGEPHLSPDKTKLLISLWYYEGSGSQLISLNSKTVTPLPFGGYVSGLKPLGWYGQNIIVHRYGYDEKNPRICLYSIAGVETKCYPSFSPETYQSSVEFLEDHVIYTETKENISDQYICVTPNQVISVREHWTTFSDLDLRKSTLTALFSYDSTDILGKTEYEFYGSTFVEINGKNQMVIWLKVHGEDTFLTNNSNTLNDVSVLRFE